MRAIYYPNVFVSSQNWLKFALLYFERICPITPFGMDESELPNWYREALESTDLLRPHVPSYQEGDLSTCEYVAEVDSILANPSRYRRIFRDPHFLNKWTNSDEQTNLIYEDKYTHEFQRFFVDNQLGTRVSDGILMHRDLAGMYMTILAQVIAEHTEMSVVTDSKKMSTFSFVNRRFNDGDTCRQIMLGKKVIELGLPSGIQDIDIRSIIALRNTDDYRRNLHAFHRILHTFCYEDPTSQTAREFIAEYKAVRSGVFSFISGLAGSLIPVGISAWTAIHGNSLVSNISSSTAGIVASAATVAQYLGSRQTNIYERQCGKFLSTLRKLPVEQPARW